MQSRKIYTRDSAGLTDALFDAMEDLRDNIITHKMAMAMAALAEMQLRNVALALQQQSQIDSQQKRLT